jgi:hypothetical protein
MRKSREADREYKQRWAKKNRPKLTAQGAAWRERNREQCRAYSRAYQRKKLPPPTRLCPPACEVCGSKPMKKSLCLDHEHLTHTFRGWICDRCNKVLGLVHDMPAILRALAVYLEQT